MNRRSKLIAPAIPYATTTNSSLKTEISILPRATTANSCSQIQQKTADERLRDSCAHRSTQCVRGSSWHIASSDGSKGIEYLNDTHHNEYILEWLPLVNQFKTNIILRRMYFIFSSMMEWTLTGWQYYQFKMLTTCFKTSYKEIRSVIYIV